jgi:hypothetical protein
LLQNGRKVGWFAMEARTSSDADYEANYTLYKATLEQCVVSVEGKVYIGCQVLLGNSGNATLIKKNTAVVQFNVRKSVAINNDILVLDTDQTTTDVLESYKNLLKNALTTYATKATTYTKTEVDSALALKADKSDTYTKQESDNKFASKTTAVTHTGNQLQDYSGNNIYPNISPKEKGHINELRQELKTDYYFDGIYKKFIMPDSAFDVFDIDIFSDGRNYIHNYNIEKYKNTGGTTYYFSPSGNNNNDGLSELTPKQSPSVITSYYNDGDTIILMDGLYKRDSMPIVAKNLNIIAKNTGKAYVVNSDNNYIYTKTIGYTNVYETTRSSVVGVIIKNDEKYIQLSLVNSIELVDTTPLSFTVQSGITYINVSNIVTPNNNTVFLNLATGLPLLKLNTSLTQDITLYIEGVNFIGGQNGGVNLVNTVTYTFNFYAKDCNFIGANTSGDKFDALSIRGGNSYLVNCKACYSNKDGFNYHSNNGVVPKALEINCEGYGNGNFYNSNNTYNGSTAHDGVIIIRINGVYHDNKGGNVADVNENTKSLNIRCVAFNSISSDTGSNTDFVAQQTGATMWLYNCKALNSDWSIYAVTGTTIYKKNCDYKNTQGSGSIIDL